MRDLKRSPEAPFLLVPSLPPPAAPSAKGSSPLPFWWLSRWGSTFSCHFPSHCHQSSACVPTKECPPFTLPTSKSILWDGISVLLPVSLELHPVPKSSDSLLNWIYLQLGTQFLAHTDGPARKSPVFCLKNIYIWFSPFILSFILFSHSKTVTQLRRKESVTEYENCPC